MKTRCSQKCQYNKKLKIKKKVCDMKCVLHQVNSTYSFPCRISHSPQGAERTLFLRDPFFSWAGHILQGWILMLWVYRQQVHYTPLKSWATWKSGKPYRPVVPNVFNTRDCFFFVCFVFCFCGRQFFHGWGLRGRIR